MQAAVRDRRTLPRNALTCSACRLLRSGFSPQTDPVAFRIAEGRDAQTALGPSWSLDGSAMLLDATQNGIDVIDIDEREDAAAV